MAIEGPTGKQDTFGTQLNRMAGAETEKNLFAAKNSLGKDAFLKMFTEQLKNQDPLNPMHNEQFSQQMAMFSQLEQQITTNKNLEKMIQQQSNTQIAALQLVGKNILADRAGIYHDKDKPTTLSFKLPADASELKVQIVSLASGDPIRTIPVGAHQQGDVSTRWDGMNEEGRPMESGRYSYRIVAKGLDDKDMAVPMRVDGRVNGVTTEKGVTYLLVGDQKIGLSDVETIKEADGADKNSAAAAGPVKPLFGAAPANAAKSVEADAAAKTKKPAGTNTEDQLLREAMARQLNPVETEPEVPSIEDRTWGTSVSGAPHDPMQPLTSNNDRVSRDRGR